MAIKISKTIRIVKCNCKHEFQDSVYGKGNRVANITKNGARCTVCKSEHK